MRQFLTPDVIANAIRMTRSLHKGAFLILEGVSDGLLFQCLVDEEECRIEVAYGKSNVLQVMRVLNSDDFKGALGVIDSDYDELLGNHPGDNERNIVTSDDHDIEVMMIKTAAFDRLISEYGVKDRVDAFAARCNGFISATLARHATAIGALRLVSLRDGLNLDFEGLSFREFVSDSTLAIDVKECVKAVLNNSQKHDLDAEAIGASIQEVVSTGHSIWKLSCGHDVLEIMSIGFRRTWCSRNAQEVGVSLLHRSLRLAYNIADFWTTELARRIVEWEQANSPYRILLQV